MLRGPHPIVSFQGERGRRQRWQRLSEGKLMENLLVKNTEAWQIGAIFGEQKDSDLPTLLRLGGVATTMSKCRALAGQPAAVPRHRGFLVGKVTDAAHQMRSCRYLRWTPTKRCPFNKPSSTGLVLRGLARSALPPRCFITAHYFSSLHQDGIVCSELKHKRWERRCQGGVASSRGWCGATGVRIPAQAARPYAASLGRGKASRGKEATLGNAGRNKK